MAGIIRHLFFFSNIWGFYKMFEDKLTKAIKLAENEKHEKAIKLCNKILKNESDNVNALKLKANCLKDLNQKKEALKYYDLALETDPERADILLYKAEILLIEYGRYDEACECIDLALDLDSDIAQGWFLKGLYYGFMGDVEKGIDCYDVGLHIDSGDANGWLYKGGFLKIAKKYDEAVKCFDAVLAIKPNDKEAIYLKADAYLYLDELDKSIKYCNEALGLDGGSVELNVNLYLLKGCLLILSENFDEAIVNIDNALKLNQKDYNALLMKAQCLAYRQDFEDSLELIDNTLKIYPDAWEFLELKQEILS